MKKLQISENLNKLDLELVSINKEIKAKKMAKRDVLKALFQEVKLMFSDPKFEAKEYLHYTDNGKKTIVEIELEKAELSKWTLKLLMAMLRYYATKSSLDFSDKNLTLTKFFDGMKLLGNDEKYSKNSQLFKRVLAKDLEKQEKALKAKKEKLKAMV